MSENEQIPKQDPPVTENSEDAKTVESQTEKKLNLFVLDEVMVHNLQILENLKKCAKIKKILGNLRKSGKSIKTGKNQKNHPLSGPQGGPLPRGRRGPALSWKCRVGPEPLDPETALSETNVLRVDA